MRRCIQANKAVMNGLICAMRKAPPSLSALQLQSPLYSALCKYGPPLAVLTGNCSEVTPIDQAATARWWIVHQYWFSVSQGRGRWLHPSEQSRSEIAQTLQFIFCPVSLTFTVSPGITHTCKQEHTHHPYPLIGKLEREAWLNYETLMMTPLSLPYPCTAMSLQGKLGPPNTPDRFSTRRNHINKEKLEKHRELFIWEKHAPWDLTSEIMGPGQSALIRWRDRQTDKKV